MPEPAHHSASVKHDSFLKNSVVLVLLTCLAVLVMGYHPGLEDDAFYLAAIKRDLNPALFPHDSEFFRLQFQATIFDKLVAFSDRLIPLPLAWTVLLWQFVAFFLLVLGSWRISRRCFVSRAAQWSAVFTITLLLSLPLPGIAIYLADQYLHPRTLATAAILAAIVAVIDRRPWLAGGLLAVAFVIHAIMASFGISFCGFLFWRQHVVRARRVSPFAVAAAMLLPLEWIFEPASDAWRQAAVTRGFYFLNRWHWYDWFGVVAPLALVYLYWKILERGEKSENNDSALPTLVSSLFYFGVFQTVVGLLIMLPPSLERLRPFEPMRCLHLLYFLFFVITGGLLGQYVLKRRIYRWVLLFVPLGAIMFYAQQKTLPASAHLELPGRAPENPWLQAFEWIRQNTPVDSLFALDPHYMTLPGEDYHGFRPLAERSVLADYEKDGGMAARVPRLAPRWFREVQATSGWRDFHAEDFQRLKKDFGVTWVVLSPGEGKSGRPDLLQLGMICPYRNRDVEVCRLY